MSQIHDHIRAFIVQNALGGKDSNELQNDTPLISSRMMDSIVALKLVSDLEARFNIEFEAHEVTQENLNTINSLASFVESKMK